MSGHEFVCYCPCSEELEKASQAFVEQRDMWAKELARLNAENEKLRKERDQLAIDYGVLDGRLSAENERLNGVVKRAKQAYKAWEEVAHEKEAENEQLRNLLAGAEQRAQEVQSETEQLTVELHHRVGWEERCLDAKAAAARLERQNAELAREAIGMKAAWLDLKTRDQKDFVVIANERDALRPIVEAAILFRDARIAMQSQGWAAHAQEAEALEALFKSITAFARQKRPT